MIRVEPNSLRIEHLRETLGIGVARPRISWRVETDTPDWIQAAYEVEARDDADGVLWTTGHVESRDSVLVPWGGAPLASRQRASLRARCWGADGVGSQWSEPLAIEAGLLDAADWSAQFITPDWDFDPEQMQPSPMLRREFTLRARAVRARLYVTALGVYEAQINGRRVGDHVLAPGWTSYDNRLRYQTFDVLDHLRSGPNAIGAMLGEGWFTGMIGFPGAGGRNLYGDRCALLARLEVAYADGTTDVIVTDASWKAATGPITSSGIYDGERYDARLEQAGWSSSGFDDSSWSGVRVIERDLSRLIAPPGPPVRCIEEIAPVAITTSPSGKTIVDFGQNASGWLRLAVDGPAGTEITIRHAEILLDGELCTEPLRGAKATDTYILRGGGPETWEPRFTFHGFRYAEITGWPGEISPDALRFIVLHSDMERTGWFECSDPLVNRLHENAVWSMKSNFLDVPTDCPQRDERLGWTGDLSMFAPTGAFLYDAAGFLQNWLADLAADQLDDGVVPMVIPDIFNRPGKQNSGMGLARAPLTVWSDAAVLVPWVVYQRYGDACVLEAQYDSMKRWVDCIENVANEDGLWDRGFQFADWLDPMAPPDSPQLAMTDTHLIATAYFCRVSEIVSESALILGHEADADRYRQLSAKVRAAFKREYVTPSGRTASDTQTALSIAILFGMHDTEQQRFHAGERLASLVKRNNHRIATGFVGTALVSDALCATGHEDTAFRMLVEQSCPSWLYPITQGATTIWERWDSLKPDGSINSSRMTSFNHYALGAVGDWLHRSVGGLAPLEPGYRKIEIHPRFGGGITWAKASHRTPYGLASSSWRIDDGAMRVDVTIPPNTTARVVPPDGSPPFDAGSGGHSWTFAATGNAAGDATRRTDLLKQ